MTWIMSNPQDHNMFGSLGNGHGDTYNVNDDCLNILEEILRKLAVEDPTLRTFRRAIGFGQNISNDLIPLLIHVKDNRNIIDASEIIDTTIKILVNLTIPVECLLSIDAVSRTDVGRHTIFELNRLLTTSKEAFTDSRSTKAVMDHMKHVIEKDDYLSVQQCDSINNCLLLLRNVLHIPEIKSATSGSNSQHSCMQNEIIWNLFTQSIDKIIIHFMSCSQKMYWGVTMVQLIALMYKDQHVGTLQKLLNLWLEASLSESSEDNESNTSPPDQGSGDSSPIITSDPTSDSSDGGNRNNRNNSTNNNNNNNNNMDTIRNKTNANTNEVVRAIQTRNKTMVAMKRTQSIENDSGVSSMGRNDSIDSGIGISIKIPSSFQETVEETDESQTQQSQQQFTITNTSQQLKKNKQQSQSEISDCGYVTQTNNQESICTSSNDDDQPHQKPVHQKPHTFQKTRYNNQKNRTITVLDHKELRRKKLVKRSKTNIINMKGLMHHQPTDENISNILKEFTVDFLLKGYGSLVYDLHSQLLTNTQAPIDTSHFFWLVTYFLKFATQLELDLEHISPVLSYDIISYLIFQGVWLYEELEINLKTADIDLRPSLRRLHLVVTAIREFLQAMETYHKLSHICEEDRNGLTKLKEKISQTEEFKSLFLLLLRQYDPDLQSRQYLQDLIVTNHTCLIFLDNNLKMKEPAIVADHIKQFATVKIMRQYGLLLEDFKENGEFVNNCVFTMMHHVGGDLNQVSTLFQPSILKTFSQIWEIDYEICDDWSDLIEFVIHKFINTPRSSITSPIDPPLVQGMDDIRAQGLDINDWGQDEKEDLRDFYNQSKFKCGTIENITKQFENMCKKPYICTQNKYEELKMAPLIESDDEFHEILSEMEDDFDGDINVLKEYLYKENYGHLILWLQNIIIEACYAKMILVNPELTKDSNYIAEPSAYYHALLQLPIPVVPWTCEQSNVLKHQPFILLLHKLGFYLPEDTGKIFVRIPSFWTADYLFSIAQQLGPIDTANIKFNPNLLVGYKKLYIQNCAELPPIKPRRSYKISMDEFKATPTELNASIRIPINPISSSLALDQLNLRKRTTLERQRQLEAHMDISASEDDTKTAKLIDKNELNSAYESASLASDLTRMCVSDEEDKTSYKSTIKIRA